MSTHRPKQILFVSKINESLNIAEFSLSSLWKIRPGCDVFMNRGLSINGLLDYFST